MFRVGRKITRRICRDKMINHELAIVASRECAREACQNIPLLEFENLHDKKLKEIIFGRKYFLFVLAVYIVCFMWKPSLPLFQTPWSLNHVLYAFMQLLMHALGVCSLEYWHLFFLYHFLVSKCPLKDHSVLN